jgi:hypothetical protein
MPCLAFCPCPGLIPPVISSVVQAQDIRRSPLRLQFISFKPSTPDVLFYPWISPFCRASPPPPIIEHHSATPLVFDICSLVFIWYIMSPDSLIPEKHSRRTTLSGEWFANGPVRFFFPFCCKCSFVVIVSHSYSFRAQAWSSVTFISPFPPCL